MSNTEAIEDLSQDPFNASVLEGATFRVDWASKAKVRVSGRGGGEYDAPCILADVKGYVVPLWVQLTRKDYDSLRLLKVQGIKTFTCTLGQIPPGGKYAPRFWTGGKEW